MAETGSRKPYAGEGQDGDELLELFPARSKIIEISLGTLPVGLGTKTTTVPRAMGERLKIEPIKTGPETPTEATRIRKYPSPKYKIPEYLPPPINRRGEKT